MLVALRRGLLAGVVGGLLAGACYYLLVEGLMDRAVRLEAARSAAAGEHPLEVFSRHTQHVGAIGAMLAVGLAFGVLFAVVHEGLQRFAPTADPWPRALRLGGAAFFGISLVPFLRYPSNPPGVGDPGTLDTRQHLWFMAILIGLVGAAFAGLVTRGLRERGTRASLRQLAAAAVLLASLALAFVLPANSDPVAAPVQLVWQFRLLSLTALAALWAGLAVSFGLLGERAARRTAV